MICPYSFDEPVGSGIPALLDGRYWCMGHIALGMSARRRRCPEDCPVDMGEWGAWRSFVGQVTVVPFGTVFWTQPHMPSVYPDAVWKAADAAGWSP